jgi:hypothetical protein
MDPLLDTNRGPGRKRTTGPAPKGPLRSLSSVTTDRAARSDPRCGLSANGARARPTPTPYLTVSVPCMPAARCPGTEQ